MQALVNGAVIADAAPEDIVLIEGNRYFPPASIAAGTLEKSPTPYTCPWKGVCQYFDVVTPDGTRISDGAWSYPNPYDGAEERVGHAFANFVAFAPGATFTD
ncbi:MULTISPECIES: DUF427 domain-containing protein [Mycetocola]|uniref:DUF427 domain-containing protein n=1 Tax=Mycetocola lacteus TaxID=76637 RepID=A0A3L7AH90_9MICO|nr:MULTISPECIES: DUF427 domain-containing protein [Mycetocola]RLP79404.1 DUF427 domain-containing protein [Mycetocola lacteus]